MKPNPIQNIIISLVSISNRKQKPLDQLLQFSQLCLDYFSVKYGLVKNTLAPLRL